MARLARLVLPGVPHHVTQRGNRRLPIFFNDDDRHAYLALIAEGARGLLSCLAPTELSIVSPELVLSPELVPGVPGTRPRNSIRTGP